MMQSSERDERSGKAPPAYSAPAPTLPTGGGAIRGIGEKFGANAALGTGALTVPIPTSPSRSGFGPQLSLSYDSGSGNGPFGFGWNLSIPAITRKTDKGLPLYYDADESDVFVLSGAEDLVPLLHPDGTRFEDNVTASGYTIHRYRPRIEGLFARIERWTHRDTRVIHWRSISRDNVTTLYGTDNHSRIFNPADSPADQPTRIFSWLISHSYDDKGNAIVYEFAAEGDANVDKTQVSERNRVRTANRYLKRIKYGNRASRLVQPNLLSMDWLFEVVFDYDEAHYEELEFAAEQSEAEQHRFVRASIAAGEPWRARPDAFSTHRSGFEIRTYRRCRRVLMFHRFPELGTEPCLVRSTEFDYADLDYTGPVTVEAERAHQGSSRFASFIRTVRQSGYVRDETQPLLLRDGVTYVTYLKKSLPVLELGYSKAVVQDEIRELDAASLENLPVGIDGRSHQWVDLDGEGISGILTEQAGGWFYKPNLGDGRFGPMQSVSAMPASAALRSGRQQLMDLAGDGQLDLVAFEGATPGFYERTQHEHWEPFRAFRQLPNVAWDDPNVRFVDLDGDGHADVLITEGDVFTWHRSLAEEGFGPARQVPIPPDEELGPRLVLADGTQSIYVADMCGDGLTGLVRIRNGEVCYWPSVGYGHFGAKVTMDNAPWFDTPDHFAQSRVRLADVDGSGTTDIIYLGRDDVRLYSNQSGNRWSEACRLVHAPRAEDDLTSVMTADLLGTGTACLVWSSPLPGDSRHPIRYLDLMGGQKPHLLVSAVNNFGAETRLTYAPSTKFALADKRAGQPWITRLAFPVHVVERVETIDRVSGNRFVTRYAYHHGHFDGIDREFRGFGLVEQWDTEEFAALGANPDSSGTNLDATSHVPPVLTRTWFHTGLYAGRDRVSNYFAGLRDETDEGEYYREPGLTDAAASQLLLADTILPPDLTVAEEREASRALKSAMLRREVYGLDGTTRAVHPYTVVEQNYTVRLVQPSSGNRHAVFLTHPRETIAYQYDRQPADPRVMHTMVIETDEFGTVLKSAAIGYGRRAPDTSLAPDAGVQLDSLVTYEEQQVTNTVDTADDYRAPVVWETRTYELTGYTPTGPAGRFEFSDFVELTRGDLVLLFDGERNYEEPPGSGRERRLIDRTRALYRRDDLAGALPPGTLESLALPFEHYKVAFTPGLLDRAYADRVDAAMLDDGRYVTFAAESDWWAPSGRVFYSPDAGHSAVQELAFARAHFFLPHRYRDPFHTDAASTESVVSYDDYELLVRETRDPLGNRQTAGERHADPTQPLVRAGHDYRVLQPALLMDFNRNRTAVAFDAFGTVVGSAVMGKPAPAPVEGDSLDGFEGDLTEAVITGHVLNPLADPDALLGRATTRMVYDLFAYQRTKHETHPQPAVVYALARETHDSEPVPAGGLKFQHGFTYFDGFGREIQRKIQAEPGPVPTRGPDGNVVVGADGQPEMTPADVSPRWVGSGWTIFNNKGKPVRQYEPFFTDTHRFEFDLRIGVSKVLFYDAIERVVATLHPNHTWDKVVFHPWRQETWDANDTVLVADPATDPDVGDFFSRLPDADYLPTWYGSRENGALGVHEQTAARQAAVHAGTPTVAHADALGRTFLTIAHNTFKYSDSVPGAPPTGEFHRTRIVFDIEDNQREIVDADGRIVVRYDYDMAGTRIHQASMEAGERRTLHDVTGKPIFGWNGRNQRLRFAYDVLRRMTESFLREGAGAELLVGRTVYGETQVNPEADNLRGKVIDIFDQAGVATSDRYDFKGNALRKRRQLAVEYTAALDWSADVPLVLPIYTSQTRYDALNRPTEQTAPDDSVIRPSYNEASLVERVEANLQGAGIPTPFVTDIDYNARGHRTSIEYGNGVTTTYTYDPITFRLVQLLTTRDAVEFPDDCPQPAPAGWPGCAVQNVRYTYDAIGNITRIRDDAQQTIYFRNRRVEPSADYVYDALYRLIEATGREHLGQTGAAPSPDSYNDMPHVGTLLSASDGDAMGRYLQRYVYDAVGNITETIHRGSDPAHPGWTRTYTYNEPSSIEPARQSNRLTSTTIGSTTETYSTAGDGYDAHGNTLHMPQLQAMAWDFQDRLQMTRRQAVNVSDEEGVARHGERTWYVYDDGGQRVRKVTELATGAVKEERIYVGGFEIYRRHGGSPLVRETLHVMDGAQRVALVETRTEGTEPGVPAQLTRYQFGNHLGSSRLELDDEAEIVSYEEYLPFGSTSYQAVRSAIETPKRYRSTGKERDEESGFYYHGARYCAPWLGRWVSCDPAGLVDGTNLYKYASNNPIRLNDPSGRDPIDTTLQLPTPSLLDPRSFEERMLDQLAGTFVPQLRSGPSPDFSVPGALPFTLPSASSTGSPATSGTASAPSPETPSGGTSGPDVDFTFPPRLSVDWGPTHLVADTSSATFQVDAGEASFTAGYAYGGDISFTSRGATGAGTVSVNPDTGLAGFRVEGTFPGATARASVNTEGGFGMGLTVQGFGADAGFNPSQSSFSLSLSFGGQPAPIYAPGSTSTLLPDLGGVVRGGVTGATNLLGAAPDIASGILADPTAAPDVIEQYSPDIDAVTATAGAASAIADVPSRPAAPDFRFRFNLSYSPLVQPDPLSQPSGSAPAQPVGGLTFSGMLQIVY